MILNIIITIWLLENFLTNLNLNFPAKFPKEIIKVFCRELNFPAKLIACVKNELHGRCSAENAKISM